MWIFENLGEDDDLDNRTAESANEEIGHNTRKVGFRKCIVLGSLNVNSLLLHVDEIHTFLKERGIYFLALNETKLDDTCSDVILNIEGYKFGRLDRNRNGGGVAFYCKETF